MKMKMKMALLLFLFCLAEADDLRYEVKAMFQQLKSELEAQNAGWDVYLPYMSGLILTSFQWCKVPKYIYSSTVLKYDFEVLVLYWSISNCLYLYLYSTADRNYYILKHTLTTLALFYT